MARGIAIVELTILSGGACDQNPQLVPDRSVLRASGDLTSRADGLTHYTGNFTLASPSGTVLFQGNLQMMDRIGTHSGRFGTERCNEEAHLEA